MVKREKISQRRARDGMKDTRRSMSSLTVSCHTSDLEYMEDGWDGRLVGARR